jgi:hypothetical protein
MLLAIYLILTLVVAPVLVGIGVRQQIRETQRTIDRAIWPWAQAYMDLRDERDQDGELFKGDV